MSKFNEERCKMRFEQVERMLNLDITVACHSSTETRLISLKLKTNNEDE